MLMIMHTLIRLFLFFMNSFMIIMTAYYAKLAQINLGIISSIFSLAIVFNTVVGRFLFGEKLNISKYLGMVIIVIGVIWISLLKGKPTLVNEHMPSEDELTYYKVMALISAFIVAL